MAVLIFTGLLTITHLVLAAGKTSNIIPIKKLVEDRGYPLESVTVHTDDGYELTVHRMRHGYKGHGTNRVPVLLQHGILGTSAVFMATAGCLAYHLADRGFDVWMGNTRGNIYSTGHKRLKYKRDKAYWNFSFHEMGVFDLPAVFKEIRTQTGVDKVHFIGHSMGTTQFLVFGAMDPSNLDNVGSVILMAPVARPKGAFASRSKYYALKALVATTEFFGSKVVFKYSQNMMENILTMCNSKREWVVRMCKRIIRRQWVLKKDNVDFDSIKTSFHYYAGGAPAKTYKHYLQIAKSGIFRQYDYKRKNKYYYATPGHLPPAYDLKSLTPKMYLVAGGNDAIAAAEDVKWLHQKLPNSEMILHVLNEYVHQSFIFGQDLKDTLFRIIDDILTNNLEDLEKYIDH